MSLADYLAKKYLTADKPSGEKKSKKRKRNGTAATPNAGLIIADDDESGWGQNKMDIDEDDRPVTGTWEQPSQALYLPTRVEVGIMPHC